MEADVLRLDMNVGRFCDCSPQMRKELGVKVLFFVSLAILLTTSEAGAADFGEASLLVDGEKRTFRSGFVVDETHHGGKDYRRFVIHLYSFQLSEDQLAKARVGDFSVIDAQVHEEGYNTSRARVVLAVYQGKEIHQMDISFPGYGCTVKHYMKEKPPIELFGVEGTWVSFKDRGSSECGFKDTVELEWDLDLKLDSFQNH